MGVYPEEQTNALASLWPSEPEWLRDPPVQLPKPSLPQAAWVGKIPWRRKWQPTPVFLENPMERGAWQATVHGVVRVGYNLATKPPPQDAEGKPGEQAGAWLCLRSHRQCISQVGNSG